MLLPSDSVLALLVNALGVAVFALIIVYHYVEEVRSPGPVKEADAKKKKSA